MDHGIDTGGSRMDLRQSHRQFSIQKNEISVKLRGNDPHLGGFARGDDRDVCDFRTCTGRGRHQHERQA
ncbi:hypothetical protein D3C87_1755850 [compost metagenome]